MTEEVNEGVEHVLEPDSELRLEIEDKNAKIYVTLISGFAEMFGTELVKKKKYEIRGGGAFFTYQGCVLNVIGKTEVCYISKETPMVQYLNCHAALESISVAAEEKDERGPVCMVAGPKDVGKSTLCRILLNYAVRRGRRPLYVDTDVGQGSVSIPGSIATILIERPASIEEGFSQTAPLVYHFGHTTPSANGVLYKTIISKMSQVTLGLLNDNKRTKYSGVVINTCGWVKGDGYLNLLHVAQAYNADAIFVLDQERLYNELLRDVPSNMRVLLLPKSGGVVERSRDLRNESRYGRVKEYFYGNRTPLYPFSFEVKFSDLKLYKIGAPPLPDSCMPIGMKAEDNKTKLVAVTLSHGLLHHILSVSFAETIEDDVIGSNLAGFVCVTDVDMERQSLMILSPQPRPLPNTILLLSEEQFMDSHA